MNIITSNPVTVNRRRLSSREKYVSFVGDVSEFQIWANNVHKSGLVVDGIAGPKTNAIYKKYGKEWESLSPKAKDEIVKAKPLPGKVAPITKADENKEMLNPINQSTAEFQKQLEKEKGMGFIDKIKAMSTTKKVILGITGGSLVLGLLYLAFSPKPSKK